MPWTIDYYSEAIRLEIEALPVGIRAAYARLTELLEEFGLNLRMPHSRAMGKGLYELRPRGREGIARVFYCTLVGRGIIILHSFIKKTPGTPEAATGGMHAMTRKAPRLSHRQMVERWKKDPTFLKAYTELDTEFALLRELLLARQQAGLSQAGVAKKMGTKAPAVTRLETSLSGNRHSPTIATLKKYAKAVGCSLEIRLVRTRAAER